VCPLTTASSTRTLCARLATAKRRCSRLTRDVGLQRREERVNAERNLSLLSRRNDDGAWSAADFRSAVVSHAASRLRSSSSSAWSPVGVSQVAQVTSFRAGLRSVLRRSVSLRVASKFVVHRRVAGQSVRAGLHHRSHLLSFPLPNKALVPTAQTQARLGSRAASGAAAAQRRR
jgi:hypothetical protein